MFMVLEEVFVVKNRGDSLDYTWDVENNGNELFWNDFGVLKAKELFVEFWRKMSHTLVDGKIHNYVCL